MKSFFRSESLLFRLRELHLYLGFFLSPFALLFAASSILFNHPRTFGDSSSRVDTSRTAVTVRVPQKLEGLDLASSIRDQAGLSGEILYFDRRGKSLFFPVGKPGLTINVTADLESGLVQIEKHSLGPESALLYLHKSPGPHVANIRGNWVFTRLWGGLADLAVYALLLLTLSGIYLWYANRLERTAGLVFLAAGGLSFFLLLASVVFY